MPTSTCREPRWMPTMGSSSTTPGVPRAAASTTSATRSRSIIPRSSHQR
ncbi:hypothetical protein ACFPRL_05530 [Pseudoclavibacter helvolus]